MVSKQQTKNFAIIKRSIFYLVAGSADDGREDGAGSVVSGESGFAHSGSVVDDKSGGILVTHLD
jgi:hypothetical protein